MKVVIPVPKGAAAEAESFARLSHKTLSQLYTEAVAEYLSQHDPDRITKAINKMYARLDKSDDAKFSLAAARRTLKQLTDDGGF